MTSEQTKQWRTVITYSEDMRHSIDKVAANRKGRTKQSFPKLTPDEKKQLLTKYHPDYKPGTTRKLLVGPNKGEPVVNELGDIVEAYSRISPEKTDLSRTDIQTDVLIIGGGGAGASAALTAQEAGAHVLLCTKLRFGDANTMMAQGGIQAADRENDSPAIHHLDVMGGGGFTNIPNLVQTLVKDAPSIIEWLEDLGMMFDKKPDGTFVEMHGGGTSRRRMHAARDYTGAEIMRTLRDEVINRDIQVIEFSPAIELLTDADGNCVGAILLNMETNEFVFVNAKTTILATGGSGRLHCQEFPTTNHYGATGDGLALAYRAGAKLAFVDTIQYHPTGVAFPELISGQLITEKMRSMGAQLVNIDGERFVNELETRDAVASAIIRECQERNKGVRTPGGLVGVWLDTPLVDVLKGSGQTQRLAPAMVRQFKRFGIDIIKDPILVYATQHYQNGGVLIDENGRTNVPNLYVAGEAAGGIHGRNRLMGNSLLDILVFGRRAGGDAAKRSNAAPGGKPILDHVVRFHKELKKAGVSTDRHSPVLLPDYRSKEAKIELEAFAVRGWE
jgi:succinate dehydrogenase / fumarate reductase flavoprotein subunit